MAPYPDAAPSAAFTAGSLRLWNHALTRMMSALWACVLIAPFAVSQCLGVPDPSDGVGVTGVLPASGQCFCLFEDASTRIPGLKALRFPPRKRSGASVIRVDPASRACLLSPCEDGSGCDENKGRALPISTVEIE